MSGVLNKNRTMGSAQKYNSFNAVKYFLFTVASLQPMHRFLHVPAFNKLLTAPNASSVSSFAPDSYTPF
jgi:hypothetical protein